MLLDDSCLDCGMEPCACPNWVYVDLGEDTHLNLGARGSVLIKQRNGSDEDVVHLSPNQVYMLEQMFRSGVHYPENDS